MKNKKIFRTFAALCTCLMLMGGFSVTAFAQGADPAPTATPAADATNDSNVVVEETEDSPALTPVSYTHLHLQGGGWPLHQDHPVPGHQLPAESERGQDRHL